MADPLSPQEAMLLMCHHARQLAKFEDWLVNEYACGTADELKRRLDWVNHYAAIVKTGLPDG